ncbi:sporulation protein [Vibrio gazogenes]|uniref:Sporulation-control protein n=1 Tax=Vibrio gazogenes DSM 21264 = NBRC 103151 TaxID=1123492 RepID=A0A1M5HAC7_VIBGA|nr:sporulation protein [Vibrio gazogenes]USP13816.1 sporulation protein [Vibrio gazogenes]SHG12873.1 sporulation-control protein [Vibrio gazogenes DSM 21264] [Vibrio gazogenes DSM 21264 = NBRC 103151]SJN53371.1 Sporulation-control protein spo0M [Vibrio gazogenes]
MSFLKKTLASFGIGSAKVDSILQQEVLQPGQQANVTIHVYGGATAQDIDNIEARLCCRYIDEEPIGDDRQGSPRTQRVHRHCVLDQWRLPYAFTIHPGETRDFLVTFNIPWNTPITIGDAKVWLETGLDIALAADPTDKDEVTVRPEPLLDAVFSAFESQGFRIRQVECEAVSGFELPFVQEFEFVPTTGPYHGRWREVEVIAYRSESGLELWFEIDRQQRGVSGMLSHLLGSGALKRHLMIPLETPLEQVAERVFDFLEEST